MRLPVLLSALRLLFVTALAWSFAAGTAQAATATYSLLLDTDSNAATGCSVTGPSGPIAGIEQVATTVVDTTSTGATVTRLERQVCSGGVLGAPSAYDPGGWPVGFGNGTGGAAVIESSIPLGVLPPGASMRAVAMSSGGGGQDVTTPFAINLVSVGAPSAGVVPVPLSPWLVLPLAAGILLIALWMRRRYPHHTFLAAFFVVFALSGLAWAATVIRDGNVGDWSGVPPAMTDPKGDAPPNADIVAVFYQQDASNLYLRYDSDLRKDVVNQAPVVSAGSSQTITLPAMASLQGTASDDGLPNPPGALTLAWSKVSGPGTVIFANASSAVTTASFSLAGTYVLRLTANDSALSSSADVTITVNDVAPPGANQPPVVSAGAAQSIALPSSVSLSGTATDDGKPTPPGVLMTTWSVLSGPGFVTFANANALSTQASFSAAGTYVLQLTAFDGELSASANVQVTVADGGPQVAPIADRTIVVGTRLQVVVQATDAGGDALSYALPTAPPGAGLSPAPLIDWTPSSAQVGTHAFTVQVSDTHGHAASVSFNVTVTAPANTPPKLGAQENQVVAIGTTFARKLSATDPDAGEVLVFSLQSGPSGMTLSGADLSWPTTGRNAGDYGVTVRVTDRAGAFDQKSFTVTLQTVAGPLAKDDSYTVRPGATLSVPAPGVLGNDTDPNGGSLAAQKLTDPNKGSLTAFNANGSFTYVAPLTTPPAISLAMTPLAGGLVNDSTGYAWAADINHDGGADVVTSSFGTPMATSGKTGARLWTGWDTSATSLGRNCLMYLFGTDFALGDVDGSGDITMIGGTNCDATYSAGVATRLIAVDTNPAHAVAGAARVKWVSERLDEKLLAAPSVGAPPVLAYALDTRGGGLASSAVPTLARLTSGGAVKVLTRILIGPNMYPYDRDGDGTRETYAGCAVATGNEADVGTTCSVTFIVDAATGVKEAALTAPNPRNQYETQSRIPFRQLPVVVADLDGDGQVEIVSGRDVYKYAAGHWTLAWQAPEIPGAITWFEPDSVSVADLDGDGKAEVIMQSQWDLDYYGRQRGFLIYSAEGTLLRWFTVPTADLSMITIADVDGDGASELVFSAHGIIYAYRPDGTMLWASAMPDDDGMQPGDVPGPQYWPQAIGDRTRPGNAVQVYDLQLDGAKEVIANGNFRIAIIDGKTGVVKRSIHHGGYYANNGVPMIVDADGDGHAEIFSAAAGTGVCGGCATVNTVPFAGEHRDWAPAPLVFNQASYNPWAINDSGAILYDGGVHRSFRNQRQLGTVVDPRTLDTATFTYAASGSGGTSAPAKVSIQVMPTNSPPVITSTPPTSHLSYVDGSGHYPTFLYQITATDPDAGDTIRFELVYSSLNTYYFPQATVDPVTGVMNVYSGPCGGYGGPCDMGTLTFIVAAVDSFGARAEQSFFVDLTYLTVTVPDVVGQQVGPAKDAVRLAKLTPRVVEVFSALPAGTVVTQSPAAGTAVTRGSTILLGVSKGPQPVTMPFVVGKQIAAAHSALAGLGLSVNVTSAFSTTIPAGEVMTQSPAAGTSLIPATALPVELTVSAGGPLPAPIASIKLVPGNATRIATEELAYRAIAKLTDGTGADVTFKSVWSTSVPGVASVTPAGVAKAISAGSTNIRATVGSAHGDATLNVVSRTNVDTTPPVAQITAPAEGSNNAAAVTVTGSATDANFARYELAYAVAGSDVWITLAEGTAPVSNGALGTFDPTMLANDMYVLRLTVYDRAENVSTAEVGVQVTGRRKPGLFSLAYTDLNLPSPGVPVAVQRLYDSRVKTSGDFGVGWRLGIRTLTLRTNRVLGTGWERTVSGPTVSLNALGEHRVSVTLSDGTVEVFDMVVSPTSNLGSLDFTHVTGFTPRAGTLGKLEYLGNPDLLIVNDGARDALVDDATLDLFDPRKFRYTTLDGMKIEIDRIDGVSRVEDRNGNTVSYGPAGIIHSSGQSVLFNRDAKGRVVQVVDPKGQALAYAYDENGDLVRATDATGAMSTYRYDPDHNLIEANDASGRGGIRSEYDAQGRLIGVIDAAGRRVSIDPNVSPGVDTITDRRGNATRVDYDADGNVTKKQATVTVDGTLVNAVTSKTYDGYGNETAVTDPDGRKASATFNGVLPASSVKDPGGLNITTSFAYNGAKDPTQFTDGAGRSYAFTYDGRGNIVGASIPSVGASSSVVDGRGLAAERTDALGNRTTFAYDAAGRTVLEEVYQGGATLLRRKAWTYDANGNVASETLHRTIDGVLTPLTTQFAYDSANRVVAVTDPAGGVSRVEYDAAGRETARVDALGRRTTLAYDLLGQPTRVTFPDGSFAERAYDANGNVASETDRAGRVTMHSYDELDRRVATTRPGGATERSVYSAGGVLIATIDERGNRTDYAYDAAGRLITTTLPAVTDAASGTTSRPAQSRTLDGTGLVLATTDAKGRTTTSTLDASGRPVQVTMADGSVTKTTYDTLGRRTSRANEENQVASYGYDALGRVVSVSGLDGSATFTYDEGDSVVAQTDALGRITRLKYDRLGRLIERAHPSGASQRFAYDAVGNRIAETDGLGRTTTYTYDAMNRVVRKDVPGAGAIAFTYTADDKAATAVDGRGTTTYAYDARGRLASVTQPTGEVVSYAHGNDNLLTSIATSSGSTVYGYDALKRLTSVNAPEGASTLGYDLVGNRVRGVASNGTSVEQAFDLRDRPTSIAYKAPGGAVLASFGNTWSAAGRRMQTVEIGGATETFAYDAQGRVTGHVRTGVSPIDESFAYDAVGNRTQSIVNGVTTAYSYDVDDRLVTDGTSTFTYDANGNLVGRSGGSGSAVYVWDAQNRLRSIASSPGGAVQYDYDAYGRRVQATAGSQLTRFLIAEANPTGLPQVLEERDGLGNVAARYTYATSQLAMSRGGVASFPFADASGSVRALSNAAGAVTDTYAYGAYGTPAGSTGSTVNPYRFAGQRLDAESGLYHLRARQYDPVAARMLGRDPLPGRAGVPVSLHRYLYANDDPVNFADPTGEESLVSLTVAQSISSTIEKANAVAQVNSACNAFTTLGAIGYVVLGTELAYSAYSVVADGWGKFKTSFSILAFNPAPLKNSDIKSIDLRFEQGPALKLSISFPDGKSKAFSFEKDGFYVSNSTAYKKELKKCETIPVGAVAFKTSSKDWFGIPFATLIPALSFEVELLKVIRNEWKIFDGITLVPGVGTAN